MDEVYKLDAQVSWRALENLKLSVVGENLIKDQQSEFNDSFYISRTTDVPRSVYGKLRWDF